MKNILKSIFYTCAFVCYSQAALSQTKPVRTEKPFVISGQLANYTVSGFDLQYNFTPYFATNFAVGGAPNAWGKPGDFGLAAEIGAKGYFSPDPISGFGGMTLGSNGMASGLLGIEYRDT